MKKQGVFIIGVCFIVLVGLLIVINGNKNHGMSGQGSYEALAQTQVSTGTSSVNTTQTTDSSSFQPFYVYADKGSVQNHYIPSGFMPDGKCLKVNDAWIENCHSGKSCIQIAYDVACSAEGQKWAGVYWQNPANNWGSRKGGFNLTGATKLTFWAKGERGGERLEEFKIGGLTGDYPDSDTAMIGPVILTNEWKQYAIDLRGKDLSYISGGFAWSANVDVNPESCTFYLDDLKYE